MPEWKPIPGETPIDPSGLRDTSIRNRKQLNEAEGRNIASAIFTYLIGELTPEMAPFDLGVTGAARLDLGPECGPLTP